MKIVKRLFSVIIVLVFILSALSACHGSRGYDPFVIPDEFDTSRQYEITFWAKNDTNKNQTKVYYDAIASFSELYPNITVNMRLYTDYGRIYNDVITNISTKTTPNVCITYPDHIATYMTGANTVVALNDLISDEKYGLGGSEVKFDGVKQDEMIPKFLGECAFDGLYYAVPYMRSTEVCYINKTYVEALGYTIPEALTWDFIWEVSDAAMQTDAEGNYVLNGQKVMIPFIYKSTDNMMIQYTRQSGGGYSDSNGKILLFNDNTKDFLYTIAKHVEKGAFSTFKISSYPANFLNAGQSVFAIDSTAGSTWMGTDAPLSDISADKLVRFETAVMTIPQVDPENPQMISQGPSICVFNKDDPQEVLASWLFTQYLLTNDVQIPYSKTEGYVPVTLKAQSSEEYLDYLSRGGEDNTTYYDVKIKASKILIENINNTFVTPVFNGSASLRDAAGQLIENVTKSVRRNQTVDEEYINKLYNDVISLYRLKTDGSDSSPSGAKTDLGALPSMSVGLIVVLVLVWFVIIIYVIITKLKNMRSSEKHK